MPVLQTKIEGRGNGIKTVVPNMEDVARALNRPPSYPTKFFGTELGAQTTMANDRYIVNGAHQADRLRELLDSFIDKFVLCASCKNPETELVITGKGRNEDIHRDCKACGAHTGIDMRHKLTTFILNNRPKDGKKGGKKGMTAEANVGGPMVFDEKEGSDEGDAGMGSGAIGMDAIIGRGADPVLSNPDAICGKVKDLNLDDDDDDDADSPYGQLGLWLEENRSASDADIIAKIKELDIVGKHKALVPIGAKLFTDKGVVTEIPDRAALLQALVTGEKHQKSLLGGIERLVGLSADVDDLIAQGAVSKILMALYQDDVLDEDVAKQWGTHVSKKFVPKDVSKKVRKNADAFLKWLDEADESDSE